MDRKWFDYFSIFTILFVLVSFALYYGKVVNPSVSFILIMTAVALFIIRTILRMFFFMKDRKN